VTSSGEDVKGEIARAGTARNANANGRAKQSLGEDLGFQVVILNLKISHGGKASFLTAAARTIKSEAGICGNIISVTLII
jgi:hypothetical protein